MARKSTQKKVDLSDKSYAHIDTFINTAKIHFGMSDAQVAGFKAFMHGKFYQYNEKDFIPYLEKYLGKTLK